MSLRFVSPRSIAALLCQKSDLARSHWLLLGCRDWLRQAMVQGRPACERMTAFPTPLLKLVR